MQKIVKLNRAFLYCCMVVVFCLHATGYAAPKQGKPVTISIKNSTLADVLRQVSKKSGLYIYFQDADLAAHKNVTIDVRNKPVESVLHELLDGRGLSWVEVSENTIAVKKKSVVEERKNDIGEDTVSTITVTGRVVDEKGEPVIGATVMVKGGKVGTITNPNGDFVLNDVKANAMIVISNVSSLPEVIPVRGRGSIGKILLKGKVGELDEVVVIPYGSTTRRLNTGNVVSIKSEDIEKQPVNNPLYALQGRVAGLQILPTTGLIGGAVNVQIRGVNSLRQSSNALIVVDGLPIANNITGVSGNDYSGISQISSVSFLNPNNIESIEVLKDADATSIYGSRGANGVILITTKRGKPGRTKVDISVQTGWANVPKKIKLLNTKQYLEIREEGFSNSGVDFITRFPYGGPPEYKYLVAQDLFLWNKERYTDWQKELIGGTAQYNDIQGTASGGNENIQYILGGNYHKETTVFPGDNSDQRGNAHLSIINLSSDKKFRAAISASYITDNNTLPPADYTNVAVTLAPNAPALHKLDGSLNWEPLPNGEKSWDNPLYNLNKAYNASIGNLLANANISYEILPSLILKSQVGYNLLQGKSFRKVNPYRDRSPAEANVPGFSYFNTNAAKNISVEPQLLYKIGVSEGILDVLLGTSIQNTSTESQQIGASGFTSDALFKNLAAATNYFLVQNSSFQYKYAAFFGRVGYNWRNKYLINLNIRRDGSSRFGPGNQFGTFGSVGAAWIFTEDDFFKTRMPFLSFGKLRFSYGSSGNDGIGDYVYLDRYEPVNTDVYQGTRGYRTKGLFNSYYAWEVTKKFEFGIETAFWKDRFLFSTSYFRDRSNNQLLVTPFPSMAGMGSPLYNLPALIQNNGVEVTISSQNVKRREFSWKTEFNFTLNRNKLISFPGLEQSPYYTTYEVGQPFSGVSKRFNLVGVDPLSGKYQFETIDKHVTFDPIDNERIDGGKYLRIMTAPQFYGGVANTLTYKGISLDIFFQFVKQNGVSPLLNYISNAGQLTNLPIEFTDRWQNTGDLASIQKIYFDLPGEYRTAIDRQRESNSMIVDASFIRVKNLALSYSIPDRWREKLKMQNLRFYLQGQNLLTFTSYKGLDPETQNLTSLPPLRVLTFGIQIVL